MAKIKMTLDQINRTFMIGCTHFGHEKIIDFCGRPFRSVEDMDESLIRNWNRAVGRDDTVIILGDFSFHPKDQTEQLRSRLNGNKVMVLGNHDDRRAFPDGVEYLEIRVESLPSIVLFHYPIQEWNGYYHGAVHFHAHTHSYEFETAPRCGCVGAEAVGFAPISVMAALHRLRVPLQGLTG